MNIAQFLFFFIKKNYLKILNPIINSPIRGDLMGILSNPVGVVGALIVTLVASIMLIVLSIIYFAVTLLVVNASSLIVLGEGLDPNWAVFSAAILSAGAIVASALEKKL